MSCTQSARKKFGQGGPKYPWGTKFFGCRGTGVDGGSPFMGYGLTPIPLPYMIREIQGEGVRCNICNITLKSQMDITYYLLLGMPHPPC